MTFDIDKAMSERFAKGPEPVNADETEKMLKSDTEKFQKMRPLPEGQNYNDLLAAFIEKADPDAIAKLKELLTSGNWFDADRTLEQAASMAAAENMMKEKDREGKEFGGPLDDSLIQFEGWRSGNKPMNQIGADKPRETNVVGIPMGDSDDYSTADVTEYDSNSGPESRAKAAAKEAKKTEGTKDTKDTEKTEPAKKSFDIDSRMAQWDAAGRSQHTEDTETILRGGNPYVEEKRGREDFKDPENVFQFMEWMFGPFDYGQEQGYLKLKSLLKENPELARSLMAAIEQTTLQTEDFRGRGDSMLIPAKYQDAESGMNRIGADRPRQEAWEEFSFSYPEPDGEGGYYTEEATVDDDVTEERPGPTSRAKAAAEEAKGGSKGNSKSE